MKLLYRVDFIVTSYVMAETEEEADNIARETLTSADLATMEPKEMATSVDIVSEQDEVFPEEMDLVPAGGDGRTVAEYLVKMRTKA